MARCCPRFLTAALLCAPLLAQHLQLPSLPYNYDGLEPYFDEATMQVHHLGHMQAYTDKTNAALAQLRANATTHDLAKAGLDAVLRRLEEVPEPQRSLLRNQGGGFINHELWFAQLDVPIEKGGVGGLFDPKTAFGAFLITKYVSFEIFKELFKTAALK